MKKIKIIFSLGALILMTISCTKNIVGIDENTNVSTTASNGLNKIINISTDNSGKVTITPLGNAISTSTVFYGHGTGTAASSVVPLGGATSHIYPEGAHTITITNTDLNGNVTSNTYPITVTYRAPENLLPNKSISNNGAAVKPTALYASSYKVDWGDASAVQNIALGGMENHIYAAPGTYTAKVTAISGNATYAGVAFKDTTFPIVINPTIANPFAMPITFDNAAVSYFFGTFGGGQAYATVANPSITGINTTAMVGRWTRGWDSWSGTYSPLNALMDFGTTKKIKMYVYNTDPTLVGKLVNAELEAALGGVPGNGVGVKKVALTTSGAWEELVFDFSTTAIPANAKFGQLVLRFNDSYTGNTAGLGGQGSILYFDNIRLTN
ncbi:MAG: hypothetical protein ABL929_07000 [Ferruginibacter sp.]|nr:hypothetical protein [Ferruginibacter sp.]